MIDPRANEAACRFLTAEIERLQLLLAQAVGNLHLVNEQLKEANEEIERLRSEANGAPEDVMETLREQERLQRE